jgi:hypothetical protein
MGGACGMYEGKRNVRSILVVKPEIKRPLRRHRPRWENNIKINIKRIKWEQVDWVIRLRLGKSGGLL